MGAILRLAESLDRSRHGIIRGLTVHVNADQVLIELEGRGDAELEVWEANRQLAPLERVIERPVRLQIRIVEDQDPQTRPAPAPAKPRRRRAAKRKTKSDAKPVARLDAKPDPSPAAVAATVPPPPGDSV